MRDERLLLMVLGQSVRFLTTPFPSPPHGAVPFPFGRPSAVERTREEKG